MSNYSDWRSDLREVMDDDEDKKKVTGKGVNNNKLIKINPKLGEAVEKIGGQILEVAEVDTVDGEEEEDKSKKFEKEKQDKIEDKNKKKEMMLKKRIVRMKMMAVNQGAGDSLVAHHEPEGELVEASAVLDANKKITDNEKREKMKKELIRLMKHAKDKRADINRESVEPEGEQIDEGEGHGVSLRGLHNDRARLKNSEIGSAREKELKTRIKDKETQMQQVQSQRWNPKTKKLEKNLGSRPHVSPEAQRNEEVEVNEGVMKFIKDRVGGKKKPEKKAEMDKTTEKLHDLRRDKFKTDKQKEHEKYVNFMPHDAHHESVEEGVKGVDNAMRRADAEDRKAGKKTRLSPSAGRNNVAKMLWDIKNAKENAKARGQNEEVVTELNRFGKETGKATGSLNKRPGSPVATSNQPGSAVNIVRRMIRKDTGRPEGQQKKVKGSPTGQQPGDRKLTPAQTISRMRAQVAAADAAMRDTRGT